jgi:hypothetical protein
VAAQFAEYNWTIFRRDLLAGLRSVRLRCRWRWPGVASGADVVAAGLVTAILAAW